MRYGLRSLLAPFAGASFRRFLAVGLSNFLISYACFIGAMAALASLPGRASISQVLSYGAGVAWSYYWNRRWSFGSQDPVASEGARFVATQLACLIISSASIGLAVDGLRMPATPSWFVVMIPITLLNFALLRSWVFRNGGPGTLAAYASGPGASTAPEVEGGCLE
jgi:putative flippase GtrA